MMMQSYTMTNHSGYCMMCAAAGTSMRRFEILGTVVLAVSIIVRLLSQLVLKV